MSVQVSVDDSRFEAWLDRASGFGAEFERLFRERGSVIVREEMRSQVPIRSGFLRESITTAFAPDGFLVYPTAPYAGFVDRGTGPHMIFPSTAKILRFERGGAVIFARHVHHPGFTGRFFVLHTLDRARDRLMALVRNLMEELYGKS